MTVKEIILAGKLSTLSIDNQTKFLDLFIDCFSKLIINHQKDTVQKNSESDAKMMLQMMFSKLLHLRKLLDGVHFKNSDFNIIDNVVVASLIRTVYEAVCCFHIVFFRPKTDDEKMIMYNLWVISGLKYRQRFNNLIVSEESRRKSDNENNAINDLKEEITNSTLYNDLSEENQDKVLYAIRKKKYSYVFDGFEVKEKTWKEIPEVMGCKETFYDELYNYFSLQSHPTIVSLIQFRSMYEKGDNLELVAINVKNCLALCSFFLADYMKLFPNTLNTFEQFTEEDKLILLFWNKNLRD